MRTISRVQTGVRLEPRTLKVLKATAEMLDISLGELVEAIAWHAFEGKAVFSEETRARIAQLKAVYELEFTAADSHHVKEGGDE